MNVTRNIVANFAGAGWNGVITLLATPVYISLLGMEGYGLVGFWIFLQMALSFLDFGLGPALVREFAATDNGQLPGAGRRGLLHSLEWVYGVMAFTIIVVMSSLSDWIANSWLNCQELSPVEVARALMWMSVSLGLQFPCGLYSNGLVGLQRQVVLNIIQAAAVAGRHLGGLLILAWTGEMVSFFMFQSINLLLQGVVTRHVLGRYLGEEPAGAGKPSFARLKSVWRFSAGMGVTMIAGVGLSNIDRFYVSAFLPVTDMGKYTLAATAAAMTQLGIQPFYRAYFPRWSELHQLGRAGELRLDYFQGCRRLASVLIPISLSGIIFAPEIFLVWAGQSDGSIVSIFRWLMLGMAAAGLMWLPAALQQAKGWTSLHAGMMLGALGAGVVVMPWAISRWGVVGATVVWILHGSSELTLGLWLMHRRILRGESRRWCLDVLCAPLLVAALVLGPAVWLLPAHLGRWTMAAWVVGATALALGLSVAYDQLKTVQQKAAT